MPPRLVSVALPVYNGEKYVEAAIRSLLGQIETCEIVVSDDCSTDSTRQVVQGIKEPQVVLIENRERVGQFENFNRAIRATRGEYIQLFSDDDVAHPGFLAAQIASLERDPAIGMAYASCNLIDANGCLLGKNDDDGTPLVVDFNTYLGISSNWGSISPAISCVMLKRHVLEAVGLFDGRLRVAGDLEFYNRVGERFKIARNRAMLLDVRTHSGSVTFDSETPLRFMQEELDILPYYRRHLGEAGYKEMIRVRTRRRGAYHAKCLVRFLLQGRFNECRTGYRTLSKVHNVPLCILHAFAQSADARIRGLLSMRHGR